MRLRLPATLHYPIIIRKIEKQVDDEIKHRDTLFTYTYIGKVKHQDRYSDEEVEVDKVFPAHFQSTLEGTIESWLVWEGDEIRAPRDILEVNEPCKHSVQFNGMCVECGRDMTEVEYAGDEYTERANIQGAHDTDKLLISQDEASEVDQLSKRHLLNGRKLSLVVDLDQTIIHAAVDPTIGEWQKDPENPNYDALKDVRAFQLKDEGPGARACWYYIKLRPGLEQFLENVSEKYELHIYTMGTRQYAKEIAKIVDPDRKYFEDRILSRDESGSMVAKNLTRLFPVDTRMVVIIDDRADVWRWSPNLLRVSAFDFFIGIGDINAGFLPKRQEIQSTKKIEAPNEDKSTDTNGHAAAQTGETEQAVNGDGPDDATPAQTDTTALQQVVAMTRPDADATIQEQQLQTQDEVIASQLEDKPLLRLQQKMDEKDGVANDATPNASEGPTSTQQTDSDSSDSETSSGGARAKRHSILRNDDEELIHLERSLRTLHERFYAEYDRKRNSGAGKGARVAALAGKQKPPIPDTQSSSDAHNVPDVKKIMPALKQRILAGVVIVFSGVLPLNTDIQNADVSIWAKSFGATISDKVNKETTHVIAARVGTAKVKTAVKRGIKVVGTDWLMQSIQQWRKLDERPYMLKGIGQKELLSNIKEDPSSEVEVPESDAVDASMIAVMGDADLKLSSEEDTSAVNDTDDSEDDGPKKKRLKLNLEETPVFDPDAEPQIVSPESPVELHADEWADMDDELKEFMGSDLDSESDAESVRSDRSLTTRTKKRSRDDDTDGESGTDGEGRNGETEHKRPKRTSALRAVKNAGSSAGSTPKDPGQEVPTTLGRAQTQDEYDAELALELEQQMEAAAEEEENS